MIGNDIVDLAVARRESNWQRPRYLNKLFTATEQALIRAAPEAERQVWLLWACKEAAYKAWSTETSRRVFAPKQLRVVAWQQQAVGQFTARLATPRRTYCVQACATTDYVRARTLVAPLLPDWQATFYYPEASTEQVRQFIRCALRNACTQHFHWQGAELSIRSNTLGRPILYHQGKPTPVYLSWAHHGAWAEAMISRGARLRSPLGCFNPID
ncbi:MAG: 4-phosphopantetheinyl transferase family protein [Bacteroidetes bacterium]|nr:MAG: 4-phosphopantetheinyl transferase family protein [Bacteroidota bacterium]